MSRNASQETRLARGRTFTPEKPPARAHGLAATDVHYQNGVHKAESDTDDCRLVDCFACEVRALGVVGDEVWVANKNGSITIREALSADEKLCVKDLGSFVNCFLSVKRRVWMGCQDGVAAT